MGEKLSKEEWAKGIQDDNYGKALYLKDRRKEGVSTCNRMPSKGHHALRAKANDVSKRTDWWKVNTAEMSV